MTEEIPTNNKIEKEKIEVFKFFLQELIEDPTANYSNSVLKVIKSCISVLKGEKQLEHVSDKQYLYVSYLLNYNEFFNKFLKLDTIKVSDIEPYYKELHDIFCDWKSQSDIISDWKDKYTRLYAEFDNYKKRAQKEKIDFANEIKFKSNKEIINILDDLSLAKMNMSDSEKSNKGLELIFSKLDSYLENNSIKRIDINKGDKFNSEIAECIATIPSESLKDGDVIDILKSPYSIDGKIVRFGQVVVCKN